MADTNLNKINHFDSFGWASRLPRKTILASAMALMMGSSALAETCADNGVAALASNAPFVVGAFASVSGNVIGAITTAQTAFLLQSTAFVSNPGNPAPEQQGSGVWTRAVGGYVDFKTPSSHTVTSVSRLGTGDGTGTMTCDTKVRSKFAGVQVGHDVARLNWNGFNVHFGTTAGYIETRSETDAGSFSGAPFNSSVQSPFAGTYLVISKGGFFADALLRFEHYEATFNSISATGNSAGIVNQTLNARGVTVAASAGYHHVFAGTKHFFEPSIGVVASRTKIDTFNFGGLTGAGNGVPGALQFNDVDSVIGRAGFRVGTTWDAGQWVVSPFAAASIWHEFADAPSSRFISDHTFGPGDQTVVTINSTGSNVGTYGQFSLGMSGQLVNTGWVAFARVDYRTGNRVEGWDGTGGIRYHFTPEPTVALVGKSPVYKAAPAVAVHSWTGAYMGVSLGAVFGRSKKDIPTDNLGVLGTASSDARGAGAIGGAIVGYNWQFNPNWVGGIEANLDLTNLNGSKECAPLPLLAETDPAFGLRTPMWNTTCHFESKWLATLTGRLGYVWGRALWYVKGGGAWTRETASVTCNVQNVNLGVTPIPCAGQNIVALDVGVDGFNPVNNLAANGGTARLDRFGFTVGYGVEFALTHKWTARAETSYYNFGTKDIVLSNGTTMTSKYDMISTKIGVAYKLTDR
jgi:opacity protein-like surface antigen